ncbi:hypothetical protein [Halorussus pelagicus]|uniref:hypothetical protein n=1 Tax=Halorussus pelagicus TaxID=2505977 RepID=UPI000FFCC55A|nr:hypothetical protein [Halorussus pelagicus]
MVARSAAGWCDVLPDRYSTLLAAMTLLFLSGYELLAIPLQMVIYVRAYAAVWVALEDLNAEEPAELLEPYWLSVPLAVTIGASTASVHVLVLRSPMVLAVTLVVLTGVLEEVYGIHRHGTAEDVTRLRALVLDE